MLIFRLYASLIITVIITLIVIIIALSIMLREVRRKLLKKGEGKYQIIPVIDKKTGDVIGYKTICYIRTKVFRTSNRDPKRDPNWDHVYESKPLFKTKEEAIIDALKYFISTRDVIYEEYFEMPGMCNLIH